MKERGRFVEVVVKTSFGPFVFDRAHQLLAREGQEVPLPPRVIGVLGVLAARPGEIVSKQELMETVWKDAFVSDTSLAEAISFLRQARSPPTARGSRSRRAAPAAAASSRARWTTPRLAPFPAPRAASHLFCRRTAPSSASSRTAS